MNYFHMLVSRIFCVYYFIYPISIHYNSYYCIKFLIILKFHVLTHYFWGQTESESGAKQFWSSRFQMDSLTCRRPWLGQLAWPGCVIHIFLSPRASPNLISQHRQSSKRTNGISLERTYLSFYQSQNEFIPNSQSWDKYSTSDAKSLKIKLQCGHWNDNFCDHFIICLSHLIYS